MAGPPGRIRDPLSRGATCGEGSLARLVGTEVPAVLRDAADALVALQVATATVAAGVDFPARTVVLTVADARTGSGWRELSASELQQMTGRAGRRGRCRSDVGQCSYRQYVGIGIKFIDPAGVNETSSDL